MHQDAVEDVSNARIAAAAETFVRRIISDLLSTLPHPSDHTPPRVPHPPTTKKHSRARRRKTGKDRKRVGDEEMEMKGKESSDEEVEAITATSSLALHQRDSLILSRRRMSRELVSTEQPSCYECEFGFTSFNKNC